jgi:hypothetical protein
VRSSFSELTAALMRDERKVVLLGKHAPGKPKIQVFTASGRLIASLNVRLFKLPSACSS